MKTTTTTKKENDLISKVFQQGILFRLDSHCWWGKSSRVDSAEIEAPPEIFSAVKTLVDPVTLVSLRSCRNRGEGFLKKNSYPFIGLRGVYYVPKDLIECVEDELKAQQIDFYKERDEFLDGYAVYKETWMEKSGKYYDELLYPTEATLSTKFRFEWSKFIIDLPGVDVGTLTKAEYAEELKKQQKRVLEFYDESLSILAKKFFGVLTNLEEKLTSGDKVRPKTLQSVQMFIDTFTSMNITGNAKLASFVTKLANTVEDVEAKTINLDDKTREQISAKTEGIINTFKKAAEKEPGFKRALEF